MRRRSSADAFSERLADLLGTLESAALVGAARTRVRGLGEQLRFACLAIPCDEALVALEVESMQRLFVPAVADAASHREVSIEVVPDGTPLAFLLAGGAAHALALEPGDQAIAALVPALSTSPAAALFTPLRLGERVVGGAVLFSSERSFSDAQLEMAERLGEVLSLTVESFFTERALFELFAVALPDLLDKEALTSLPDALTEHIRALRLAPDYKRRLALAVSLGRVAGRGEAEAELATAVFAAFDGYVGRLEGT